MGSRCKPNKPSYCAYSDRARTRVVVRRSCGVRRTAYLTGKHGCGMSWQWYVMLRTHRLRGIGPYAAMFILTINLSCHDYLDIEVAND
jgi:hypothetical protein